MCYNICKYTILKYILTKGEAMYIKVIKKQKKYWKEYDRKTLPTSFCIEKEYDFSKADDMKRYVLRNKYYKKNQYDPKTKTLIKRGGDEIGVTKPLMYTYYFYIAHSWREDGKVKSKQWYLGNTTFWSIWHNYEDNSKHLTPLDLLIARLGDSDEEYKKIIEIALILGKEHNEVYDLVYDMVKDKFANLEKECVEEFAKTEFHSKVYLKVKKRKNELQKQVNELNKEIDYKEKKQKEQQEEYKRKSQEESYKRYYENNGGFSGFGRSVSTSSFSQEEEKLLKKMLKKMARELHPDNGGDGDMMALLNGIKDKLNL